MPTLHFDDTKSFDENMEAFLAHMDNIDSELGTVLRAHIDQLRDVYDERSRKDARTGFNDGVLVALDEILTNTLEEDEE